MDMFFVNLLKPFFVLACLAIGYPITYWVRFKMREGWLKRLLLTELGAKKPASERK